MIKIKDFFLVTFIMLIVTISLLEIITYAMNGFSIVHGKGYEYLKTEIKDGYILGTRNNSFYLSGKSPFKGIVISTDISLFFPYNLKDGNHFRYGIIRFTKEYYLVDSVFRSNETKKPERIEL